MLISKDMMIESFTSGLWAAKSRGARINWETLKFGPNSIDVTLHPRILRIGPSDSSPIDPHDQSSLTIKEDCGIPESGYTLLPSFLYLGAVNESIDAKHVSIDGELTPIVPQYEGRSTCARLGLSSHLSAGFGDHGFCGAFTTEITVVYPTKVYPNMRIGQVYFTTMTDISPSNRYKGAYSGDNHHNGPVPPKLGPDRF